LNSAGNLLNWKEIRILIDTEILLTQEKEAKGHKKEEAVMLINHKKALEYIHSSAKNFKRYLCETSKTSIALLLTDLVSKRA